MGKRPNDEELAEIIREVLNDSWLRDRADAQAAIDQRSGGRAVDVVWSNDPDHRRAMFTGLNGRIVNVRLSD
jgi:hypothetical protein